MTLNEQTKKPQDYPAHYKIALRQTPGQVSQNTDI